jgi:uncharacterized membrane protein YjfL (UPF0719 family)
MADLPTGNRAGLGELLARLRFVLVAIIIYRIGTHIPVPGIDPNQLAALFNQNQGTILGLANMFSGGALERMSILALGIMPYISASIIMQLMSAVTPQLEQLKKEGESGRRKISQYTRYLTVVLAIVQATGMTVGMANQGMSYNTGVVLFRDCDHFPGHRCRVHDVAGRADHGERCRQRDLPADLRRHRRRPAGGDRPVPGAGPAGRDQHPRSAVDPGACDRRDLHDRIHRARPAAYHGQLREAPAGSQDVPGPELAPAAESEHGRRDSGHFCQQHPAVSGVDCPVVRVVGFRRLVAGSGRGNRAGAAAQYPAVHDIHRVSSASSTRR